MMCPRCETMTLEERERDGILVDACRQCRGIWLDRGELEKLIARAVREIEEAEAGSNRVEAPPPVRELPRDPRDATRDPRDYPRDPRDRDYPRDPRERDYHRDLPYGHKHRRKKTWAESLTDLFD